MKKIKIFAMAAAMVMLFSMVSLAATYSEYWKQDASGNWYVQKPDGTKVVNAWLCDDAVAANGKDVWYLLDANGQMISAGLVQDGTGNYYSIETEHNGYYGMLRYKSGNYGGIDLQLEGSHNGSFAAIKNADGIAALNAKYGLTSVANINNANCVYTSSFGGVKSAAGGSGAGSVSGSSSGGSGVTASASGAGSYTVIGGPTRIAPTGERYSGVFNVSTASWARLLNIGPDDVGDYLHKSPNEKYYFVTSSGKRGNTYGFAYEMNGERLATGGEIPSLLAELGEWVVDNTKQDSMYGKTNIRFRYADGTYAGYGWHAGVVNKEYSEDCAYRYYNDPVHQMYSGKASRFFTEDGYMVRNTIVTCDFSYQGGQMKVGYDGTWIDRDY